MGSRCLLLGFVARLEGDPPMSELGYEADFDVKAFCDRFLLGARFLVDLEDEMRQFVAVVSAAHNVGWFLDPTAYRDALQREGNMDDIAELVRLAQPLAAKSRELLDHFTRETERS